jgi:hypothetical protein
LSKIEFRQALTEKDKQLADIDNELKSMQGKVLTAKQIKEIPVKISRPMFGSEDMASMPKQDWENVKKTAISQARKESEYRVAKNENTALKKDKSKLLKEKQQLENKIVELEKSVKGDLLARATKDAELYNLKNAVARIPADIWNTYTKPKAQQKKYQQEVR